MAATLEPKPSTAPSSRRFDREWFREEFDAVIVNGPFQEPVGYYPRYRSRYEHIMATYASITASGPVDVCEIGGGQHALLAKRLWGDSAVVGDLTGPHHGYLEDEGVQTLRWDLTEDGSPFENAFDRFFLCEVIAHIPIPPHVYLESVHKALRPGGQLILTTPNLHRLRNLAFLAAGREPWHPFARSSRDHFTGMFMDFSRDHLVWQLEHAGFRDVFVEYVHFPHRATTVVGRIGNAIGRPLLRVPRFRQGLVAVATA